MRISDLELGQTGYYSTYLYPDESDIYSARFNKAIIGGEEYVAWFTGGRWGNQIQIEKDKAHFFDVCKQSDSRYHKNHECFLTKQEVIDWGRKNKIELKIKRLEEEQASLARVKLQLLETEKKILETNFEIEKAKLEAEYDTRTSN